ncbi:MAG: DUF1552 domain-containing protein [Planctomycetota bacterium]
MTTLNRRELLKGVSSAAGSALLWPLLRQVQAASDPATAPKRFVFVVRSNGLRPWGIVPEKLAAQGEDGFKQDKVFDEALTAHTFHESLRSLEPLKKYVTVVLGLSGRAGAVSDPHTANFGALGMYRSDQGSPPAAETIDAALASALPGIFKHVGFKMGSTGETIAHPALSAWGKNKPIPFYCSPLLAYQQLFGSLAKSDKLKTASELDAHLLDFMVDDIQRVQKSLSGSEREKLGHYLEGFESLRDRRVRLATLDDSARVHVPSITDKYNSPLETHRLEAHFDMATAALIAGLTNVITIDADDLGAHYTGLGLGEKSVHGIGHLSDDFKKGRDTNFADGTDGTKARNIVRKFQADLIASMAEKLRKVPEGDGNMLDNTLIVLLSDAGHVHHANYQHFPLVLVGNTGRKLKTGRFLHFPSYGQPGNRTLGSFYLSLLHAAGKPRDAFGQLDLKLPKREQVEPLSELFT